MDEKNSILDKYQCPRDIIPEMLSRLDRAEMNGGRINEALNSMVLPADHAISLLLLEIARLNNNLVSCRKSAKRIEKRLRANGDDVVTGELYHVINVANDHGGKIWWE